MHFLARWCRVVAWLGISTCLLLMIIWITSLFVGVSLTQQGMIYELTDGRACSMLESPIAIPGRPIGAPIPPPAIPIKWKVFEPLGHASPAPSNLQTNYRELPLYGPTLITGFTGAFLWLIEAFVLDGAEIRRRQRGRCVACGYDRHGLASSAPCPECGNR